MKTPDNFDTLIREALKRSNAAEPQHSLPADFADRVMARIQAEKVVPFYRRRPVWLSIAAAAVIVAAVGIFFLTQPLDKPTIAQTATPAPAASDTIATQAPQTPQQLMAEAKPAKPVAARKRTTASNAEALAPTANPTDEVMEYSETAVREAEQAIELLCKNLDKGIAYMEEAGNNIQHVNANIENITNKIINI